MRHQPHDVGVNESRPAALADVTHGLREILEALQVSLDSLVALRQLLVVDIEQVDGLSQLKEVLLAPVSDQGLGDGLLALVATRVP